jgi:hypothetical protein
VQQYEEVVRRHGGRFVNDHIAFRTLATQRPATGIAAVSRLFEALGYQAAGTYQFPDQHLAAIHFQHPNPGFPKLFVSELRTWELPDEARTTLTRALTQHQPWPDENFLAALYRLGNAATVIDEADFQRLLALAQAWFHSLAWPLPEKQDVIAVNAHSQYGAWALVHGYQVNHFTALVNSHGVESLDDLEKTLAALRQAGVPLKAEIEGAPGSKLRQSATEAVNIDVPILDHGVPGTMPWTYAYFELAERNRHSDPVTGKLVRFEGFLGPQATHLFEMTRVR